jgi:protein-disulfide isomerase
MTSEPTKKRTRLVSITLKAVAALFVLTSIIAVGFAIGVFVQSKPQWAILATTASDEEFERRVADYLANNPEVIADAFEEYAQRQGGSADISQAPNLTTGHGGPARTPRAERERELFEDAGSPVRGNANGDVTLVEFFDYNCPYCRRLLTTLEDLQEANPRLRIVYKEFPILSDNSRFAARAALAARKQDKYFEFHDALMSTGGILTPEVVIEVAREVGISIRRLRRDINDPEIQAIIDRNLALAQSLRITGTPSFVVGDRVFRGAADGETLQALIDRGRSRTRLR